MRPDLRWAAACVLAAGGCALVEPPPQADPAKLLVAAKDQGGERVCDRRFVARVLDAELLPRPSERPYPGRQEYEIEPHAENLRLVRGRFGEGAEGCSIELLLRTGTLCDVGTPAYPAATGMPPPAPYTPHHPQPWAKTRSYFHLFTTRDAKRPDEIWFEVPEGERCVSVVRIRANTSR